MDDLLQQGITAYKAGKRDEARKIFITVVKQSPDSEPAWGWMYQASNNDQEQIHCLKQILRINPNSEKAKQLMDTLTGQDFSFEPSQKSTSPIQVQTNNATPVAQTEKPATSQKAPDPNQQKNTLIGIGAILFICLFSCLCFAFAPDLFKSDLNCNSGGGQVYFCLAKGTLVTDSEKLESAMRGFCDKREKSSCMILTWTDEKNIPVSMPMTDLQVSTQLAQYNKNEPTGYDCFMVLQNGEIIKQSSGCSK